MAYSAIGGSWTGNYTLLLEYTITNASGSTGVMWGWRNSNAQEARAEVFGGLQSGVYRYWPQLTINPNTIASYSLRASIFDPNGADLTTGRGRMRAMWSVPSNGLTKSKGSGGLIEAGAGLNGSIAVPSSTLHFGRRPFDGLAAVGVTLHKVTLWQFAMTDDELRRTANSTEYRRLHLLGDSFLTHGRIREAMRDLSDVVTPCLNMTQDGVGSTTMSQQVARFLNRAEDWEKTLIWVDGALEVDGPAALSCIDQMRSKLKHSRFLYVQSNPINPIGDSRRTDWIANDAMIRAYVGEDRYCPTLEAYLAAGDGSGADNTRIANGLWPQSKCSDGTHPDDNAFHAGLIYDKLAANRWAPA